MKGYTAYKVGILSRGRGYRSIIVHAANRAAVRRDAKRWLESGAAVGVFTTEKEEAVWLKRHGY